MKKFFYLAIFVCMGQLVSAQVVYPPAGQSTYIVGSGQNVEVTNDQGIIFGPGVHIQTGATFTARIVENTSANDPYQTISFSDENYLFTRNFQKAMSSFTASGAKEGDTYESITYYDGLGRPMQQLSIKASPSKEDLLTHIAYDSIGRMAKEWLPYQETSGVAGSYRGDRATATKTYYKANYAADFTGLTTTEVNAYAEKAYEASPLNRILKQAAPGQDWQMDAGNEVAFEYQTNTVSEVRLFEVNTSATLNIYYPTLVDNNAYYAAGTLQKMVTKDENWSSGTNHTTEEFTDKQGRVVLKRTYNNGQHDTYYVYDDFGNLTYVLSPKVNISDGVSTSERDELCYQYNYDHRNRLVRKKLPGKGWERIVYDKLDRPVLTQDLKMAYERLWLFTVYDPFGRVAYTGELNTGVGNVHEAINNQNTFVERTQTAKVLDGTSIYYGQASFIDQSTIEDIYTINYYDTYIDTDGLSVPSTVLDQAKTANTQGLPTVSKVRVLGTNDWITTITGYDIKGRAIYTASKNNYLNTVDIVETELDFGGKVVRTKTTHKKTGNSDIVTEDTFTYDHAGRLLRQKQKINGQPIETLFDNTYDNLGQLAQKTVGGGLQTVDYAYNVRGWLKKINDPASLGTDLFAFGINYNTVAHSGTALFNGNIAETEWRTANDNTLRWYRYGYDALNRITSATAKSSNYNVSGIAYDKMGNIQSLTRNGWQNGSYTNMDVLDYDYDSGNKLVKVRDDGNDNYGFKDSAADDQDYWYDQNGNMTRDDNKGITAIGYNHLDLPEQVTFASGNIQYVYDATGAKLKKTVSTTGIETLYAGGYIYKGNTLQFFPHPEGYISVENGNYEYVYNYVDHLGNIRLSYTDANNDGDITTNEIIKETNYYPFGLSHKGYNNNVSSLGNSVAKKYMFGGKEYQDELDLGWYDVSARNYDPSLGRWMNIDPLAEQMRRHSPYNYAFNNPIYWMDPDGMAPLDDYFNENGDYLGSDEADTDNVRIISQEDWDNNKTVDDEGEESIDHEVGAGNSVALSESDLTTDEELNVYQHYNPTDLKLKANTESVAGGATFKAKKTTTKKVQGGVTISSSSTVTTHMEVKTEGNKRTKVSDHANEIINVFAHEEQHYTEFKQKGFDANHATPKEHKERTAVVKQMSHPSWSKTRPGFQRSQIKYGTTVGNMLEKVKTISYGIKN